MCGINGVFSVKSRDYSDIVQKMNKRLDHRGPDNNGIYNLENITLGQTRLSIIDLSKKGNQPMHSKCGRYILVYNGEIYNFKDLRQQLDYSFTSETDSEVLLASYIKWGESCLNHLNGMFSFSIWDDVNKTLFIARDRMGIKPLYYFKNSKYFIFSSEIRSLIASGLVDKEISREGLVEYLQYQTVHCPNTILNNVFVLEAGYMAIISNNDNDIEIKKKCYWDMSEKSNKHDDISYEEAKRIVRNQLSLAVEKRLYSDVSSGAFLSGGIDSSIIVALMSQASSRKINTFNVSFDEKEFSESKYAKIISEKYNTDHTEIKLTSKDFLDSIPLALKDMDHPSGDGPNSWVVSKYTKDQGISMALSGLGGDELFGGYPVFNYMYFLKKNSWVLKTPKFVKNMFKSSLKLTSKNEKAEKFMKILNYSSYNFEELYKIFRLNYFDTDLSDILNFPMKDIKKNNIVIADLSNSNKKIISQITAAETQTYMQNILLRDSDQMGMAHSLEIRVPFLDHNLVEACLGFDDNLKFSKTPKKLLVDSMQDLLPNEIYQRKKMGFTFPWNNWLRNELFEFSDYFIKRLSKRNYFNEDEVLKKWEQFIKDKNTSFVKIWSLIVLEFWLTENDIK